MSAETAKEVLADAIDIRQIDLTQLAVKSFPVRQPFRILVAEQAHTAVWQHARSTLIAGAEVKEVGGILVGEVYQDEQGPYLDIKAAIIAEHTRSEGTEVAFTPETWAQVNQVKDERYPDDRIVGWYHTHPRFGIFLSERDIFIQRHSFSQPWATAFVVDPVQKTEGFFYWHENEPQEADEYWVGPTRHQRQPKQDDSRAENDDGTEKAETKAAWSQLSAVVSTAMGLLALLFALGFVYWQNYKQYERDKILLRGLQSQTADLDRSMQTLSLLKNALAAPAPTIVTPVATPAPATKSQPAASATPTPAPVPTPDPRTTGLLRELDQGLQRIATHIILLAAQITGQELKVEAEPPGGKPASPSTPAPEGNKP